MIRTVYAPLFLLSRGFSLRVGVAHALSTTSPSPLPSPQRRRRIAVVGGGASGVFAATTAAEAAGGGCDVIVLEGTSKTMTKVRISGGGRCNVLHDTSKPLSEILDGYPRGKKELRGLLTARFSPQDAQRWFETRGVRLKTEADGRMFPVTDDSRTIIDAIARAADDAGVEVRRRVKVRGVVLEDGGSFSVATTTKGEDGGSRESLETFDAVVLATGSMPAGHAIARRLGHAIVNPVPSLFTLDSKTLVKEEGGVLHGLSGLSAPLARLTLSVQVPGRKKKKELSQEGPLLVTHHGVSGPAVLRLSAFAAREFNGVGYKCTVRIHFCPDWERYSAGGGGSSGGGGGALFDALWRMTRASPKRRVATGCPLLLSSPSLVGYDDDEMSSAAPSATTPIPKRLWSSLVRHSGIDETTCWGEASKKKVEALTRNLSEFELDVTGKSVFKDEFVTAGGISLKEIDMRSMESKLCPGLFACGEVIDVDGVTGGFNFNSCWSTGHVAGNGAADFCHALDGAAEVDAVSNVGT